jgi:hypothetical protein
MQVDPAAVKMMLTHMLKPWHEAVADPVTAQEAVLHKLVADYAKTGYGKQHGAENIETLDDYRRASPQDMAESILANHGKGHDDATCVVVLCLE